MNGLLAHLKNYAPDDETRTMIRKMIQEREAYLDPSRSLLESARNQKEIASKAAERLRHQLTEAEGAEIIAIHSFEAAKKIVSNIEDTIAELKTLLHPIRRLPSDILCQIFECCTADDEHASKMRAAIRLSSVCRTWRLVAHSLGSLWGHIDYSLWNPSVKDIFEHFLMRSPHRINVHAVKYSDGLPPFSLSNFQFDRIRTLAICIHPNFTTSPMWHTTLHNLTQLKIYPGLGSAHIHCDDCLRHCKNLEELELTNVGISFKGDFVLPRLARILWREHHRGARTPLILAGLFKHAPHLKSFSFVGRYLVDTEDMVPYEHSFQPLGELTSLRVECPSSRHGVASLIRDPSLIPSIQHLTLASKDISNLLDSFVQHAKMVSLTKLTLEVSPYATFASGDGLVQRLMVLRHFQNLERLEVEVDTETPVSHWPDPNYSEYFIACLCEVLSQCTSHPNFPSLRIIRFLRYARASVGDIIKMVKARMVVARVSPEKMAPLDSVTFEDCEPLNVDEHRQLKAALGHNSS